MSERILAIYGAGGLGRELKTWMARMEGFRFIGFFDDEVPQGTVVSGAPVLGGYAAIAGYIEPGLHLVVAIGDPQAKRDLCRRLTFYTGIIFPVMIHPRAVLDDAPTIQLAEGVVITAGCALTTNIGIDAHVLINLNCTIGHDVQVGRYTALMPGVHVSGSVTIGEEVMVGSGSVLLNRVYIGARSRIGAGSVVLKDVPADSTAVGIPAKVISSL
jgi:sugar O-acyltransferase (sialic acid O-acetyltransferase NeuD family)